MAQHVRVEISQSGAIACLSYEVIDVLARHLAALTR